ncbi:hypothetical protein FVE85_4120 [Porphyridium purpureum]|uniref:Methyltransferase domain-containing protein n=1 Tax=Porphyridium purpureum TaxID=35688 RepID=A0A5J4YSD2_PORPP|nr:hypothetical protein FVE85_4120 [Porphyridium purpureum]|eukprot:POR6351..scf229_5
MGVGSSGDADADAERARREVERREWDAQFMACLSLLLPESMLLREGTMVATSNRTGMMMMSNTYTDDWVDTGLRLDKPLLDVGCAYGLNVMHAVRRGARVVGIDYEDRHLTVAAQAIKDVLAARNTQNTAMFSAFEFKHGRLPSQLPPSDTPDGRYASVLVSEVIHFLTCDELKQSLRDIRNLLVTHGTMYITAIGHGALGFFESEDAKRRVAEKVAQKRNSCGAVEWQLSELRAFHVEQCPSVSVDSTRPHTGKEPIGPDRWQTFDAPTLSRAVADAGFRILKASEDENPSYSGFHTQDDSVAKEFGLPCHVAIVAEAIPP